MGTHRNHQANTIGDVLFSTERTASTGVEVRGLATAVALYAYGFLPAEGRQQGPWVYVKSPFVMDALHVVNTGAVKLTAREYRQAYKRFNAELQRRVLQAA